MTDTTTEDEIKKLSDEELAKRLREYGESVGPLTPTTRPLFESRLLRRLGGGAGDGPENGTSARNDTVNQPMTPPSAQPPPDRYPSTPPLTPTGSSSIRSGEVPLSFTPPCTPSKDNGAAGATLSITYYGIQVPAKLECVEEKRVFINKKDVLAFLKQYPGSRFKAFSSESDAQNYADQPSETLAVQSPAVTPNKTKDKPSPVSESSAFRGPKPQDLIKLRRAIETDNLDTIKSLVWSNPRYLIGSGDTPVILQEGFRYNALHVVAMRNKAEAGRLLIDILEDEKFTELLYPDDSVEIRDARINFLVDLYLNTPEKGFCESPLHFACKFGHVEVVDLLASHPRTDKQIRNKYGELAKDIACNRAKNPSAEVKGKIYKLLEDRVYIPLLRSDDNSRPAKIAKPWSSTNSKDKVTRREGPLGLATEESPRETPLQVKAYAGPMSPSEAEAFRKFWTHPGSPATAEVRKYLKIRRGDSEKGLERIGRALAHNKLISWKEYWDFLECFTDLSTNDGLKKLESYLISQSSQVEKEEALEKDLTILEEQLGNFHLSSNPTSPMNSRAVITDPGAIFSGRPEKAEVVTKPDAEKLNENGQKPVGEQDSMHDDMVDSLARNLFIDFAKSSDNVEPAGNSRSSNSSNNNVLSKNPFLLTSNSTTTYEQNKTVRGTDQEHIQNGNDLKAEGLDSKDPQIAMEENSQQTTHDGTGEQYKEDDEVSDDSSQGSEAGYLTAEEESDGDLEFEDCRDPMVFPDGGSPTKFFVMGNNPSKTDADVLHALEGVQISPVSYPYITRWKSQVVCYSEQTRASWHSPARKAGSQTTPRRLPGAASRSGYYDSPSFENMSGLSSDSSASETDDSFRDVRANMRGSFFSP